MALDMPAFAYLAGTTDAVVDVGTSRQVIELDQNLELLRKSVNTDARLKFYDDYGPVSDWQGKLLDRVKELGRLAADWDAGGASPPNHQCLFQVKEFAHLLIGENLSPRSVTPSVEEGVAFNFRAPSKYAAVEFMNDGSIGMVLSDENKRPLVLDLHDESELRAAIDQIRDFLI